MAARGSVRLSLYWGGNIIQQENFVGYDRPVCELRLIRRDGTFDDLITLACSAAGVDRELCDVSLKTSFAKWDINQNVMRVQVIDISSDGMLRFFLDDINNYWDLDIFVEFTKKSEINSTLYEAGPSYTVAGYDGGISEGYREPIGTVELDCTDVMTTVEVEQCDDDVPMGRSSRNLRDRDDIYEPTAKGMEVSDSEGDDCLLNIIDNDENKDDTTVAGDEIDVGRSQDLPSSGEEDCVEGADIPILRRPDQIYNPENGKLYVDMRFATKKELKWAVTDHSVRFSKREFIVKTSRPTIWRVKCKHYGLNGCRWRLSACYKARFGCWTISKIENRQHTCIPDVLHKGHSNLNKNVIAELLVPHIRNSNLKVKATQTIVKERYGVDISYSKAWFSLQRAIEVVYGTWESSVAKLPAYMEALERSNPGTIVQWRHSQHVKPGHHMLGYVFWAFAPCIAAYQHCRPVISVDGTHLYTKYKHKLLIATSGDGDHRVVPLAFSLVDEESIESYSWFLSLIERFIVRGREQNCLVSDRHAGISRAAELIDAFHEPQGRHRFCQRHVVSNLNSKFRDKALKLMFWDAALSTEIDVFNTKIELLKQYREDAYNWLAQIPLDKWTLCHDGGWRHGMGTTNYSECLNKVLKDARHMPISVIVERTYDTTVNFWVMRWRACERAQSMGMKWTPWADNRYQQVISKSAGLYAQVINEQEMEVAVRTLGIRGQPSQFHAVALRQGLCSCGGITKDGIPCAHMICACREWKLRHSTYVQSYYKLESWISTYSHPFRIVPAEVYWQPASFHLVHNPTTRKSTRRGRNRTTRYRNEMDGHHASSSRQP